MLAPMPLDAPVTTATFPTSFLLISLLLMPLIGRSPDCCVALDTLYLSETTVHEQFRSRDDGPRRRATQQSGDLPISRSEEHTSELQSQSNLVCRLLLE